MNLLTQATPDGHGIPASEYAVHADGVFYCDAPAHLRDVPKVFFYFATGFSSYPTFVKLATSHFQPSHKVTGKVLLAFVSAFSGCPTTMPDNNIELKKRQPGGQPFCGGSFSYFGVWFAN
jgi:hypothetical protein